MLETSRRSPAVAAPLAAFLALGSIWAGTELGAQAAPAAGAPAIESTARIDLSIEPPIPEVAVPIVDFEEKPALLEGKATPSSYVLYSFKPPAGRLFELRLFAQEGTVGMVVYRGASKTPETGAAPKDQTEMWMSASTAEGEELRILVRGLVAGESAYKLGAKLYPKEEIQE